MRSATGKPVCVCGHMAKRHKLASDDQNERAHVGQCRATLCECKRYVPDEKRGRF